MPSLSTLSSRMYPALKRALALLYSLEKAWLTQFASGLPTHMRIRLKGSVLKASYLASSSVAGADASFRSSLLVHSGLEKPSVAVLPTFSASFQLPWRS